MTDRSFARPLTIAATWSASTRALIALAFAVLTLAMLAPVFGVAVPPLADYVNHLARMHVIAFGQGDPALDRFYDIHWQIIPNLVMDALVPPLALVFGTYTAGQIFVAFHLVMTVGGVVALHRAVHGRISPWPLVAFLFVFNHAFLYGFMNFVFASAVALWALAAWIALEGRSAFVRVMVATMFAIALFFSHLFGIGMFGLGLLAYEAWRLFRQNDGRGPYALRRLRLLIPPFLPVMALMAVSPTLGLVREASWDWAAKLDGLGWLVQAYGHGGDAVFGFVLILATALGLLFKIIRIHPAGWLLLLAGGVTYVAMPTVLFGSWAADLRLPVALVFMAIGFTDLEVPSARARAVFILVVATLALARFAAIETAWSEIDSSFDDMRASLSYVDRGAKILVANANHPQGSEDMNLPLSHAPCLAMIERSSLVSTAFTVAGKQIMSVREDFSAIADSQDGDPPNVAALTQAARAERPFEVETYWRQWPDRFDYVYVLYTAPGDANPLPDHLELIYEGRNFQLYEVIAPQRPDLSR